jgi:hypothetical protein
VYDLDKSTALTRYFQTKLAVIEVKEGETQEEAWRRYLTTNPEYANSHIKIFHYPADRSPARAKTDLKVRPFRPQGDNSYG